MADSFGPDSFLLRWLFAAVLVFGTYNPTSFSWISWVLEPENAFGPVEALVGVVLLIAWVIYVRATFRSIGWLGLALGAALFACLIWLLVDFGLLSLESTGALTWLSLILVSMLLAVGMSWSHIRRRLTDRSNGLTGGYGFRARGQLKFTHAGGHGTGRDQNNLGLKIRKCRHQIPLQYLLVFVIPLAGQHR